jgi:2',3'-cyclic-nucleotide 2'-phosphodiesterase (5'-nucleotidase family)
MKKLIGLLFVLFLSMAVAQDTFTLQVLHSSDNESAFQDPNTLEERIINYAAIIEALRGLEDNTVYLTAGDHTLPGPFYEAAEQVESLGAPGLADIAFFNASSLTANGLGNHEFDGGLDDFATMLAEADYPFLAVNMDFSDAQVSEGVPPIEIGEDGASVTENAGKVARSSYVEVNGERIGLIGRAPADFFNVINDPDTTMPGVDFVGGRNPEDNQPLVSAVGMVLEQVELLEAQGINKIILLDHAQDFTADPLSANVLRGIDIVVSAGSTGFMARPDAEGPFNALREGDTSGQFYPTIRLDSEGNIMLVVNSDQLYRYVGRLIVDFDDAGRIVRVDPTSGPIATTEQAIIELELLTGETVAAPAAVRDTLGALQATPIIQAAFEIVGTTESTLVGARAEVRGRETNLGRLAADSTLWYTRLVFPDMQPDVALKNGGGIRATIAGPNITRLVVDTALAFDNQISVVELTGDELIATMENAVSRVPAADGRFPQVAGMVLEYDPSREGISDATSLDTPSRLRSLVVTRVDGSEDVVISDYEAQGDLSRTFVLATNSFLLTGGDGYQSLSAAAEARGAITTEIGERQVLVDYITEELGGAVDLTEPFGDSRIIAIGMEE